MWLKLLSIVCAGVFIGATITEVRHLRRDRERGWPGGQEPPGPGGEAEEPSADDPAAPGAGQGESAHAV